MINLEEILRQPRQNLTTYAIAGVVVLVSAVLVLLKSSAAPRYDESMLATAEAYVQQQRLALSQTPVTDGLSQSMPTDESVDPAVAAQMTMQNGFPLMTSVPSSDSAVAASFDSASSLATKIVPTGLPVEMSQFMPMRLRPRLRGATPPVALRQHVFSIGIDVASQDQRSLPKLSGGMIRSYLTDHFVSAQVLIAKDPDDQRLYLYPGLMAATTKYRTAARTEKMEVAVANAVRDFRCLGHVTTSSGEAEPGDLGTLVLAQRFEQASGTSTTRTKTVHELAFVRAREENGRVVIHAFVTSDGRTKLHYLRNRTKPSRMSDCDIQAEVAFVEYSHGQMVPTKSVVRKSGVRGQKSFTLEQLDQFVKQQQLTGNAWDHVPMVLDAIIQGGSSSRMTNRATTTHR